MKNIIICIVCVCIFLGCKKEEKICNKLPEGTYEGYFTDNGSSNTHYIPSLIVKIIDVNTISISILPSANSSVFKEGCNLKGPIGASMGSNTTGLEIEGKIERKKGKYSIEGTHSYITYSSGQGNSNTQWHEVNGTFEIKHKN